MPSPIRTVRQIAASVILGVPCGVSAQNIPSGSTVRIWSSTPPLEGHVTTVIGAAGDTLRFRDRHNSKPFLVTANAVTRIDVAKSQSGLTRFMYGALIGGAAGAALGVRHAFMHDERPAALLAVPLGWVAGVIGGAAIGSAVPSRRSWRRVEDPRQIRIVISATGHFPAASLFGR
jgi:hypothetical protein